MNAAVGWKADVSVSRFVVAPPNGLARTAANDAGPVRARLRRSLPRSLPLPTSVPLSSYRGVAARVSEADGAPLYELTLLHADPAQSVTLSASCEAAAVAREWREWGEALRLPLIAMRADGSVEAELRPLGPITAERPSPRRSGSPLVGRRSRFGRRRRALPVPAFEEMPVRLGEEEMIART